MFKKYLRERRKRKAVRLYQGPLGNDVRRAWEHALADGFEFVCRYYYSGPLGVNVVKGGHLATCDLCTGQGCGFCDRGYIYVCKPTDIIPPAIIWEKEDITDLFIEAGIIERKLVSIS
jgi:hypothetical protein